MKNTSFGITIPHSSSPISALSADRRSYIITLRLIVHGMFQIKQYVFQIFNNAFVQFL